jgi:hypothetical protein
MKCKNCGNDTFNIDEETREVMCENCNSFFGWLGNIQLESWEENVKSANEWWLSAVLEAGDVVADRRRKYAGHEDQNPNPFVNFEKVSQLTGMPIDQAFLFYMALKWARITETPNQDFEDERFEDTIMDLANYALLWLGYRKRREECEE